jgi:hypothetical protein
MAITLKTAFDERAELGGERVMIIQMMHAHARPRSFRGVCWANTFLSCADAIQTVISSIRVRCISLQCLPLAAELHLLQSIDNLMEIKD